MKPFEMKHTLFEYKHLKALYENFQSKNIISIFYLIKTNYYS